LAIAASAFNFDNINSQSSQQEKNEAFLHLLVKHDRDYTTSEMFKRLSIFNENLREVELARKRHPDATFSIDNEFFDWTPEERKMLRNYKPSQSQPLKAVAKRVDASRTIVSSTPSFDWNNHSPQVVGDVRNQEQCGSCWAFSVSEAIASSKAISSQSTVVPLSPQELVDCDTNDDGCNGGDPPNTYAWLLSGNGMMTEADYPYQGVGGQCQYNAAQANTHISGWMYMDESDNATSAQVQTLIQHYGPPSVCVCASDWSYYSGGVMSNCCTQLDHCVQLTGFDNTNGYWNVRNSWGTSWGYSGYIHLALGNTCGVLTEATWPFVK
jgi:C1A family cysteine protease